MKRFLTLALLLLAAPAWAASYTLNTNAAQETRITRARTASNAAACSLVALPASCTQAQADAAVAAAAALVPPRTLPSVAVYATNGPYLLSILAAEFVRIKSTQDAVDRVSFDAAKDAATAAQKDAACVALGLAAGCLP